MTITDLPDLAANNGLNALVQAMRATGKEVDLPCIEDPELWFSDNVEDVADAKELCTSCLVRRACLKGALDRREPWGVWGGELLNRGLIVATKSNSKRQAKRALRATELAEVIRRLCPRTTNQVTLTSRQLRLSWNSSSLMAITDQHVTDALIDLADNVKIRVRSVGGMLTISLLDSPTSQSGGPLSLREMLTRSPRSA